MAPRVRGRALASGDVAAPLDALSERNGYSVGGIIARPGLSDSAEVVGGPGLNLSECLRQSSPRVGELVGHSRRDLRVLMALDKTIAFKTP